MPEVFDFFPCWENNIIIIKKMEESDVTALAEICNNDNVYQYISPFLYKKSMKILITAIKNLGGRDFEKKKLIIAGIYLKEMPDKLIGLAEMFDYKKNAKTITIGYRINEMYWNQGIATNAANLMVKYLSKMTGIDTIQAFVMPENIYSSKILKNIGFIKEDYTVQNENWGGHDIVETEVFTYKVTPHQCN